ncbi:MAG: type II toxin-antitoxin system RelE/ParE family toxin [Candidatus Gracilibacteria bacterium]|jgi:phage-related protein
MEIRFFAPKIENFIKQLDKPIIAKTLRTLDLLEKYGNKLGMPYSKKIDAGLFELRIRGKIEIRIIYCFHKSVVILLHAFVKKSQKIPHSIMILARKRLDSLD